MFLWVFPLLEHIFTRRKWTEVHCLLFQLILRTVQNWIQADTYSNTQTRMTSWDIDFPMWVSIPRFLCLALEILYSKQL